MSYHEDRGSHLIPGILKGFDHRTAGTAVQISGGLVRQDHQRAVDKTAGNGGALPLASGYLRRIFSRNMCDAEKPEKTVGQSLCRSVCFSLYDSWNKNIFSYGKPV